MTSGDQWTNRMEIKSQSSSRVYTVAEKLVNGHASEEWGCNCPGWKSYGNCKHLKTMGLKSCRAPSQPAPRGLGQGDNRAFTDEAYKHYDTTFGHGTPSDWYRIAEEMARGRGSYRERYRPPPRPQASFQTQAEQLALLGLTEMPATARELLRAMRKQAMITHPDHGGTNEAFREMFAAYERLLRYYE